MNCASVAASCAGVRASAGENRSTSLGMPLPTISLNCATVKAVSYTHLDVYKRQGHKNQRDAVAAFPLMLMPDRTVTRTDKFTCLLLIIRASAENVNALNLSLIHI